MLIEREGERLVKLSNCQWLGELEELQTNGGQLHIFNVFIVLNDVINVQILQVNGSGREPAQQIGFYIRNESRSDVCRLLGDDCKHLFSVDAGRFFAFFY